MKTAIACSAAVGWLATGCVSYDTNFNSHFSDVSYLLDDSRVSGEAALQAARRTPVPVKAPPSTVAAPTNPQPPALTTASDREPVPANPVVVPKENSAPRIITIPPTKESFTPNPVTNTVGTVIAPASIPAYGNLVRTTNTVNRSSSSGSSSGGPSPSKSSSGGP